jgi:hypothetical protein
MQSIWSYESMDSAFASIRLRAILLTYDILNDDDEELRDVGSSIATNIFTSEQHNHFNTDFVPLVASQKIAGHLVKKYRHSMELCRDAMERMTGSHIYTDGNSIQPSSTNRLDDATEEDTALFVVEKQNLFVDEVREAILWSQVLKKISTRAITKTLATASTEWVISGLAALTVRMEGEIDGDLGWCSKPDVFILFMQILCAADVLMAWRLRTKKVQVRGSEVRKSLLALLDAGTKNGLHEMLIEKIERVLTGSVTARLGKIGRTLEAAEECLLDGRSP